jgi:hypothetical protein
MQRRHAADDMQDGNRRRTRDNVRQGTWVMQHATADSQRPTCNVMSMRYATESVQQTRSDGQQCRKRQPSRAHWQMRNRQQTTCNMQRTTCNGRHDKKHATDNIRTTCSGRYTANNRRHATRNRQHAPTPQATCSRQHRHATQHATCSMQQITDNVEKTTDGVQRTTDNKARDNRRHAADTAQKTTQLTTGNGQRATGSMQQTADSRRRARGRESMRDATGNTRHCRISCAAGSGQAAACAKRCTRQPVRNTAQTPYTTMQHTTGAATCNKHA